MRTLNVLCTGITGLYGRYLARAWVPGGEVRLCGTSRTVHHHIELDRLDRYEAIDFKYRERYSTLIDEFRPDVVVNLGAEGNVDNVERDPISSYQINVEFPRFLMEEASRRDIRLIQLSSNAVYDGTEAPYSESSPMRPLSKYGEYKREIDLEMRNELHRWALLRPIVGYGWNHEFARGNPVSHYLGLLRSGNEVKSADDQFENPVYAGDVANAIWNAINGDFCGELNVAGGDDGLSRYDWLQRVVSAFDVVDAKLTRAKMDDFAGIVPRPRDTRFDIGRLRAELRVQPLTVEQGLREMRREESRELTSHGSRQFAGSVAHGRSGLDPI